MNADHEVRFRLRAKERQIMSTLNDPRVLASTDCCASRFGMGTLKTAK